MALAKSGSGSKAALERVAVGTELLSRAAGPPDLGSEPLAALCPRVVITALTWGLVSPAGCAGSHSVGL